MSMSRDGCIAGPNDEPSNSGDDGFDRLHEWIVTPMEIVRVIDTREATHIRYRVRRGASWEYQPADHRWALKGSNSRPSPRKDVQ
jgi:hypothetical protein